jgi:pilus assembly protein CpaF
MLRIIVVEKGGAERELFFEDGELDIGRVQGNAVMLPKPNVSKRHARLKTNDSRVVIEDLKSTNGTYVNGRRISQPRELAAEDRIYIGDFTLKVQWSDQAPDRPSAVQQIPSEDVQRRPTVAMPVVTVDVAPPPIPQDSGLEDVPVDLEVEVITEDEDSVVSPEPPPEAYNDDAPEGEPEFVPEVAPAPEPGAEPGPRIEPEPIPERREDSVSGQPDVQAPLRSESVSAAARVEVSASSRVSEMTSPGIRGQTSGLYRKSAPVSSAAEHGAASDAYMAALRVVSDAADIEVFASVDPTRGDFGDDEWQRLSEDLMRLVDRMRRENRVHRDMDPFALTQDILFEFTGLGPLEELLADDTVRAIMVDGLERIFARRGSRIERLPKGFASEATQQRVVAKLLGLAGLDQNSLLQPVVEGRLPDGTYLHVINPPLVNEGHAILLERPAASSLTIQDFVAANRMSTGMAGVLREALDKRQNVVVCAPQGTQKAPFVNALLQAIPEESRILLLEGRREVELRQANVVAMNKSRISSLSPETSCILSRLCADSVVIPELEVGDIPIIIGLGLAGQRGLVISMSAESPSDCVRRLALMVQLAQPAIRPETAASLVYQTLDVVIFMAEDDEGRPGVSGIARLDRESGELRQVTVPE